MKILALKLGKFNTMCCFFESATRKHRFLTAKTDPTYLTTVFKSEKLTSLSWKPVATRAGSTASPNRWA